MSRLPEAGVASAPDFAITGSNLTVYQGSGTSSSILVSSLNGFSGTVNLGAGSEITGRLDPYTVDLNPGGVVAVTVFASAGPTWPTPGTYPFEISGTSGQLYHSLVVYVTVLATGYCILSTSLQTIVMRAGDTNATSVIVTAKNGFTSQVHLYAMELPVTENGITASFSPATVQGSGTSTLTITTSSTFPPGNYSLVIGECDTSPLVTYPTAPFTSIRVQVLPEAVQPDRTLRLYGIPVTTLLISIGAVAIVAALAIVIVRLRRGNTSEGSNHS